MSKDFLRLFVTPHISGRLFNESFLDVSLLPLLNPVPQSSIIQAEPRLASLLQLFLFFFFFFPRRVFRGY